MLMHRGGHTVRKGTYWNIANGQRVDFAGDGMLPGGSDSRYVRMSTAMMLAAGPIVGLLFAAFLPFIGIVMTLALVGRKLVEGVLHVAVKSTSFGWRPIEAYLDGKHRKKKDSKEPAKDEKH